MSNWKANEKRMFEKLVRERPSLHDLQWSEDKYKRFDAYNDNVIVEFKFRNKKYEDTMIEFGKYEALKELSQGRLALYVVEAEGSIYVFNLNALAKENYDYRWEERYCNATSEFYGQKNNRVKKNKKVGYLDWDKAELVIEKTDY